jgi:hypothetical protein
MIFGLIPPTSGLFIGKILFLTSNVCSFFIFEIFASQGAPPVLTTPVANLPSVSTTPAANDGNIIRLVTPLSELEGKIVSVC